MNNVFKNFSNAPEFYFAYKIVMLAYKVSHRGYPVARFTVHYSILNHRIIVNEQTPSEQKKGYILGKYNYFSGKRTQKQFDLRESCNIIAKI